MSDFVSVCFQPFQLQEQKLALYSAAYGAVLVSNLYVLVGPAFVLAVAALRRDKSAIMSNNDWFLTTKGYLLVSVMLMFLATTMLFGGALYNVYWVATDQLANGRGYRSAKAFNTIQSAAFVVNVTLGQAIVIWRTIVISQQRKWVMASMLIMMAATVGGWVISAFFNILAIAVTISLAVNIWCTAIVVALTRPSSRAQAAPGVFGPEETTRQRLLARLAMYVESGVVYTGFWAITTVAAWTGVPVFAFLTQSFMSVVVALHPLLIVVLYATRRASIEGDRVATPEVDDAATIAGSVRGDEKASVAA